MKIASSIFIVFVVFHLLLLSLSSFFPIQTAAYPHSEYTQAFPPKFLQPLGSFDGVHYMLLAQRGYEQYEQAFFPLYPLLINTLSNITAGNLLVTGIAISWTALVFGFYYFTKLSSLVLKDNNKFSLYILLFFPTSFYYLTVYPESVYLLLAASSLYFFYKKRLLLGAILAALASATKIQGLFLILPIAFSVYEIEKINVSHIYHKIKLNFKKSLFAFAPLYGILIFSIYLYYRYGDFLSYYNSQEAFGAQRTSDGLILIPQVILRYINIFISSQVNFQYYIAILEFTVFTFVFAILAFDIYKILKEKVLKMDLLAIHIYSLSVLVLPTLTGTLSSIPRYALVSFGLFFAIARIRNNVVRFFILIIMGLMHITLFSFFIKGYFIS